MSKNDKERFIQIGTKVAPAMYDVLNTICDALEVDVYHLLQWFTYVVIKGASPEHQLDPRIQRIMTLLESDAGWQKAFNIANPDGLDVAQVILILEQPKHKGFGAVMVNRPFMAEATQTECVDDILERVTEVTMRGIYRRLRALGADMGAQHLSDILLNMIDSQTTIQQEQSFSEEMPGTGDMVHNKIYRYGQKSKRIMKRTPDNFERQQAINFNTPADHEQAAAEVERSQHHDHTDHDVEPFGY